MAIERMASTLDRITAGREDSPTRLALDDDSRRVGQLKACALVGRKWRHTAQRTLHRNVVITPTRWRQTLDIYYQYNDPESSEAAVASDLSSFPRKLHIKWKFRGYATSITELMKSKSLAAFVRHCGAQVIELKVENCGFESFNSFFKWLEWFPSLNSLDFYMCQWNVWTRLEAESYGSNSKVKTPPSLRRITFHGRMEYDRQDHIYDLLAFAIWVSQSSMAHLSSLKILYPFRYTATHRELARTILGHLGSKLTQVLFEVQDDELLDGYEEDILITAHPDLSTNTSLETVLFQHQSQDPIISILLSLALSSICSQGLKCVALWPYLLEPEDAKLDLVDLSSLAGLLSHADKFPSLTQFRIDGFHHAIFEPGEELWCYVHEAVALLRKRGVETKYNLKLKSPDAPVPSTILVYHSVTSNDDQSEREGVVSQ